jgi:adenylate kinase
MLNLVLFGPPGAGKGTQSSRLIDKYNLVHLSTGDIFRSHMKEDTDLGKLAKSYIEKGALVPDQVTIGMLTAEVNANTNAKGFIFDGFPRTTAQAESLDAFLKSIGASITAMLALEVGEEELVIRLLERGKQSGRSDDQNKDVIKNRIRVYENETSILKKYYSEQNKFIGIKGVGSIESITQSLCNAIDTL